MLKCTVSNLKHPTLVCTRHKSGIPHYRYFKLASFSLKSNVPSKIRALIPELRYFRAKLEARKVPAVRGTRLFASEITCGSAISRLSGHC